MNRTTAFGTWRFADDYRRAAVAVQGAAQYDMDISAPRYYLMGHAIELSLKAFLLAKGVSLEELRSMKLFGHDLEKCLERADSLGFKDNVQLNEGERGWISLLNKTYKKKEHEYITTGYIEWPPHQSLFLIVENILSGIKEVCVAATRQEDGM